MKLYKIVSILVLFLGLSANAQIQDTVIARPLSQYPPELLQTDEYGNKFYRKQTRSEYTLDTETEVGIDQNF